jgi:hypothetical protein
VARLRRITAISPECRRKGTFVRLRDNKVLLRPTATRTDSTVGFEHMTND